MRIRLTAPLYIKATGRGNRQMCRMDKFGFPRTSPKGAKQVKGWKPRDHVRAVIPKGKYKGTHIGRVVIRASGSFDIKTKSGKVSANWKYCKRIQRDDGYEYSHVLPT